MTDTATMPNQRTAVRIIGLALATALMSGCISDDPASKPVDLTKADDMIGQSSANGRPAQPMALVPPEYSVGDTWSYSDGMGYKVTEAKGTRAKLVRTDAPKQWFTTNGVFRTASQSGSALRKDVYNSKDPSLLYTAGLGKPVTYTREYTRNGTLIRHNTSWVIEGYETITVPAGTFDTIVLTKRSRSMTGNWTGYERWWYAPAAKNYVRMEYRYGEAPQSARVLTSYSVK